MWSRLLFQCSREDRDANVQREREAEAERRKEPLGPASAVARRTGSLKEDALQGHVPGLQNVLTQPEGHPVRGVRRQGRPLT